MKPKYKAEFPDYDDTLPALEGFADSSWRQDACPSLSKEVSVVPEVSNPPVLTVFVDYKDPSLREQCDQGFRYAVVLFTPHAGDDEMKTLLATSDWSDVVTFVEGIE